MLNHRDAQGDMHRLFLLFQGTPKLSTEADKFKIRAAPSPNSQELWVIQFLLTLQAWPSSELYSAILHS